MENKPAGSQQEQTRTGDASQSPYPSFSEKEETRVERTNPEKGREDSTPKTPPETRWQRLRGWVWPMTFTDFVIIVLTMFIALGTIVSAIAIGFQWHEMHLGGADTTKIADAADKIKKSAGIGAQAASSFAIAAGGINTEIGLAERDLAQTAKNSAASIKATQEAMRLDQRAWLGSSDYTYTIVKDKPVESTARITNTGKTPATEVTCRISGFTRPKDYVIRESDFIFPPRMKEIRQGTIFPNQQFVITAHTDPNFRLEPWLDNLQAGIWIQYFFGEIKYKDAFGVSHWTHFCSMVLKDLKSGTPCSVYTDTDKNK